MVWFNNSQSIFKLDCVISYSDSTWYNKTVHEGASTSVSVADTFKFDETYYVEVFVEDLLEKNHSKVLKVNATEAGIVVSLCYFFFNFSN